MSILNAADPSRFPKGAFEFAVNPDKYPHRFSIDAPDSPHGLHDTLGFVAEMSRITPPEGLKTYILAFAASSPLLAELDEASPEIKAPAYDELSAPEALARIARYLPEEDRLGFLVEQLGNSKTFKANLDTHGYNGYNPLGKGAVWPLRDAANSLGGMAAQFYPSQVTELGVRLSAVMPEHRITMSRILSDYRYVHPTPPALTVVRS